MSTDRELLELAAKAANIPINFTPEGIPFHAEMQGNPGFRCWVAWNPLEDDGDALRLAVELKINLTYLAKENECNHAVAANDVKEWAGNGGRVAVGPGYAAATRRAIVRAAAEIGRGMP